MKRRGNIDTVFVLIIFSTFAFSVLMVLALGAGIYRNISDITREDESERTALSYVRTKVRNMDSSEAISVAPFEGEPALYIEEDIGGKKYNTIIYFYDGWLCEIFCEASLHMSPHDGMRIIQVDSMRFEQQDRAEQQDHTTITVWAGDSFTLLTLRSNMLRWDGIEPDIWRRWH